MTEYVRETAAQNPNAITNERVAKKVTGAVEVCMFESLLVEKHKWQMLILPAVLYRCTALSN